MDTKTSQQRFVTIGLIFVNIFVLVAVFSFPPMCLPEKYQYYSSVGTNKELLNPSFDHFIMAELQKGIDEIQMRLQDQSSWFQYKFLFVGGLLAAFLGIFPYAQIRTRTSGEKRDSGAQLQTALQSPLATIALAAVSSLSLMIDLHIRGNAIVVNQIGLWIASHVEPLYLGTNVFPPHSLVGWETFLRRGEAMHTDVVNSITFFWPIHILTVICFLLYLINARTAVIKQTQIRIKVDVAAFWLVHSCLIVIAWTGHYLPPIFQQRIPLLGIQEGIFAALPYAGLALILASINWIFIIGKRSVGMGMV
ncbi:MAG: hypothetical protein CVU57_29430 [Deltaproteobacteria bacterium HGW-Deltaproteobacteria-15]|jgi:hypothetical protein|nr:MAG: hypothetical protein CVU57_29430 [Deltaproteobacteria bacterium HGW-Deltaproteobacteria-15]